MSREKVNYDKSEFFEMIKLLHEYQVGDEYFFLKDGKIISGYIQQIKVQIYDQGLTRTVKREWQIALEIIVLYGAGSTTKISYKALFKNREEAAEQFLKENDVPVELLKVIMPEKPKTTVKDLIDKLNQIDPTTDLKDEFWKILKTAQNNYMQKNVLTTSEYWDCECKDHYIHSFDQPCCTRCNSIREEQPNSRIDEIKPENMA